jgi:hypothetical protein
MHEFFLQIPDKMKNVILQPISIHGTMISFIHLGKLHNFNSVYGVQSSNTIHHQRTYLERHILHAGVYQICGAALLQKLTAAIQLNKFLPFMRN